MLPRANRLRRARDFAALRRNSTAIRRPALTVRTAATPNSPGRVGFIVAKTVSKSAVVRNRLRRRLRAIVATLPLPPRYDIIIITHPNARDLTSTELRPIVTDALRAALAGPHRDRYYSRVPTHRVT